MIPSGKKETFQNTGASLDHLPKSLSDLLIMGMKKNGSGIFWFQIWQGQKSILKFIETECLPVLTSSGHHVGKNEKCLILILSKGLFSKDATQTKP